MKDTGAPEVRPCSCIHEYQDDKYGKFNRLKNPRRDGSWACTVCNKKVHDVYLVKESRISMILDQHNPEIHGGKK